MNTDFYNKIITELKNVIDSGLSIRKYCANKRKSASHFYESIRKIQKDENDSELRNEAIELYNEYVYKMTEGFTIHKDENGKIINYSVYYPVRDQSPFVATLSREDAETIFGLYTYYGGNITARNVANEFPKFTLTEIKRIFRCFKLTKDSAWFPPHMLEEMNEEELSQYRMNLKERAAFKYCDSKQERDFTNQINKMASEINRLSNQQELVKSLLTPVDYEKVFTRKDIYNQLTGIICLSDLHVGAHNVQEGYLNMPEYNEDEINRRLDIIIETVRTKNWDRIVVINLGDAIDSFRGMTTSMKHLLPVVISDKEIANMYLRVMMRFFSRLVNICDRISYYSIGTGNHSGNIQWLCDVALSQQLQNELSIECYVSNNEIDNVNINNISFIYLHGKTDAKNGQKNGFPLNLNDRTQCWFNDFFTDTDLNLLDNKVILKGDLHQFSINSVSSFDYINCPSIYASSTYIVSNFGYTKWGCAYIEVDDNGNYTTGVIKEWN